MNKFVTQFNDDAINAQADSDTLSLSTAAADALESECWDLVKLYASSLNVEFVDEDGEPIDDDEIDCYCAKTVQDAILKLFTDAGFTIK